MDEQEVRFVEVKRTPKIQHRYTVWCRTKEGEYPLPAEDNYGASLFAANTECKQLESGEVLILGHVIRRGEIGPASLQFVEGAQVEDGEMGQMVRIMR